MFLGRILRKVPLSFNTQFVNTITTVQPRAAGGTLVNEFQAAGSYQVSWDARDERGAAVATGVYLSRLSYSGGEQTRRLLLLR